MSSGIEPIFAHSYTRKVLQSDGSRTEEVVEDYAVATWRGLYGETPLPDHVVSIADLTPSDHVAMQAAAQDWVDSSISKTINVPADIPFDAFSRCLSRSLADGMQGLHDLPPNQVTGSVLSAEPTTDAPKVVQMFEPLDRPSHPAGRDL